MSEISAADIEEREQKEYEDKCRRGLRENLAAFAFTPEAVCRELIEGTAKNQRIRVIKLVRTLTGAGLKEAKDQVDAVMPYPAAGEDINTLKQEINSLRNGLATENAAYREERNVRLSLDDKVEEQEEEISNLKDTLESLKRDLVRKDEEIQKMDGFRLRASQISSERYYLIRSYQKVMKDILSVDAVDEAISQED